MITDYQLQLPHTPVIGTLTHRTAALQTLTLMENMRTFRTCSCLHRCMMVYNVYVDGDGERGAEEDDCLVMRAATGATICPQGPTSHLDTDTLHCYIHYTSQQSGYSEDNRALPNLGGGPLSPAPALTSANQW